MTKGILKTPATHFPLKSKNKHQKRLVKFSVKEVYTLEEIRTRQKVEDEMVQYMDKGYSEIEAASLAGRTSTISGFNITHHKTYYTSNEQIINEKKSRSPEEQSAYIVKENAFMDAKNAKIEAKKYKAAHPYRFFFESVGGALKDFGNALAECCAGRELPRTSQLP